MAKKNTNKESWQVVKSNDFIQISQNDLTKTQKKVMAYIFSTIRKDDKEFKEFQLTVNEMLVLIGLTDAGENYKAILAALDGLDKKSWWIFNDDPDEIERIRFFDSLKINKRTKLITGKLSSSLKPFFLELQGQWTSYQLTDYLRLSSEYSMDLYEWLKSYQAQGWITKPIADVKAIMHADAPTYQQYKRFNDLILKKSIKEINEKTDIYVVCTPNKIPGSRAYSTLTFGIKAQNPAPAYGPYANVFLTDEEMKIIVYEWDSKHLVDELSRYKYINNKKGKKGDFKTIERWYKKKMKEREQQNNPGVPSLEEQKVLLVDIQNLLNGNKF